MVRKDLSIILSKTLNNQTKPELPPKLTKDLMPVQLSLQTQDYRASLLRPKDLLQVWTRLAVNSN